MLDSISNRTQVIALAFEFQHEVHAVKESGDSSCLLEGEELVEGAQEDATKAGGQPTSNKKTDETLGQFKSESKSVCVVLNLVFFVCLFVCLFLVSHSLSVCLYLFLCLLLHTYLSLVCLSVCVCVSVCLFLSLSQSVCVSLPVCLFSLCSNRMIC